MSYSIDTNLLIYATDSADSQHDAALSFLKRKTAEPEILYLAWPTAMAYLRLSTHPSVFANPLTPEEAMRNMTALLEQPRVRMLSEGENFFSNFKEQTSHLALRGNLFPCAYLATLLFQSGVKTLYSDDSEFLKFGFLSVKNPLAAEASAKKWWRPQRWLGQS